MSIIRLLTALLCTSLLHAASISSDTDADLNAFTQQGVTLDSEITHDDDSAASLKLTPGSELTLKLSNGIQSGSVTFYTKENMHVIDNPKSYHTGPHFGVYDRKGQCLSMGLLYAKYLGGDTTYTFSNFNKNHSGGTPFAAVQYVGVKRNDGWNKWTFSVNENGVPSVSLNDKVIDRIKLKDLKFNGIHKLFIKGDSKNGKHILWVDNLSSDLGKKLQPKKDPPLYPEKDPEIEATVSIIDELKGKHPRLLFTAEDIPAMREMAKQKGSFFMERVEAYVPACKTPNHTNFLRDATDGQRQGLWRLPTVALHWVITEDPGSLAEAKKFLKFLIELERWEEGSEFDCGMSSANIMIGAALAYDWLYHELDSDFRKQAREKLLLMARRQYYHGHLGLAKSTQYWQGDPANNHRWHRNAGMVLATLAAADDVNGENDYQWMLEKCKAEMDYVNKWLPADGTSHESPSYLVFGLTHLCLFTDAADRCLGTEYQKHQAFKHFPYFRLYTMTPGMNKTFAYGDSGERAIGGYNHAFFFCTGAHQDATAQVGIEAFMNKHPKSFDFGWFGLVWYDPSLNSGSYEDLPVHKFFPDMGLSFMRENWKLDENQVSMMLKCGPYGGYDLNTFRNQNDFKYINIAHDDPDANEIILFARGQVFAKPDGYSTRKKTQDHNTLIVNGQGQVASNGGTWTQPPKGLDLTTLSYTTTYKDHEGKLICEGEAGNAYADIDRFRRSVIWIPGEYILIIDDVQAAQDNQLEMRWQGKGARLHDDGGFALTEADDEMPFLTASSVPLEFEIIDSQAEAKKKILGYKQVLIKTTAAHWTLATLADAWDRQPQVSLEGTEDGARVTVRIGEHTDIWSLIRATDQEQPSVIKGLRDGKTELISCDEGDLAPREPATHH